MESFSVSYLYNSSYPLIIPETSDPKELESFCSLFQERLSFMKIEDVLNTQKQLKNRINKIICSNPGLADKMNKLSNQILKLPNFPPNLFLWNEIKQNLVENKTAPNIEIRGIVYPRAMLEKLIEQTPPSNLLENREIRNKDDMPIASLDRLQVHLLTQISPYFKSLWGNFKDAKQESELNWSNVNVLLEIFYNSVVTEKQTENIFELLALAEQLGMKPSQDILEKQLINILKNNFNDIAPSAFAYAATYPFSDFQNALTTFTSSWLKEVLEDAAKFEKRVLFLKTHASTLDLNCSVFSSLLLNDWHLKQISQLPLRELKLHCKKISNQGLAEIKNITCLKKLRLISMDLKDQDLAFLNSLSLEGLYFMDNQLDGTFGQYLIGKTSLIELELANCLNIKDENLAFLTNLPLRKLSMGCLFQLPGDSFGHYLEGKTSLKELNLKFTHQLRDQDLAFLKSLSLEKLSLSCNQLTGEFLKYLEGMTSLKELDLSDCKMLQEKNLVFLIGLSLQKLYLADCVKLTGEFLKYLEGMTSLIELDLSNCSNLRDDNLTFKNLSLQKLKLANCDQLTGKFVQFLLGMDSLKELNVKGIPNLKNVTSFTGKAKSFNVIS